MARTGEERPIIYFDLQDQPLEEFVAQQDIGSRVYLDLDPAEFNRYHQYGCTVNEMAILIFKNMAGDRPDESALAADTLDLIASIPVDKVTFPAFGPEDDKFHIAIPGGSSGEEMTDISFAKVISETKKRRNGQA